MSTPFKRRVIISPLGDNPSPATSSSTFEKILGSFRLRFKTGGTLKEERDKEEREVVTQNSSLEQKEGTSADLASVSLSLLHKDECSDEVVSVIPIPKAQRDIATGNSEYQDSPERLNDIEGSGQGLSAPLSPIVATSEVTQPHTTGDKSYHSPLADEPNFTPPKEFKTGNFSVPITGVSGGNQTNKDNTPSLPQSDSKALSEENHAKDFKIGQKRKEEEISLPMTQETQQMDTQKLFQGVVVLHEMDREVVIEKLQKVAKSGENQSPVNINMVPLSEIEPKKANVGNKAEELQRAEGHMASEQIASNGHTSVHQSRLQSDEQSEDVAEDTSVEEFHFLSPEEEPTLNSDLRQRAVRAVSVIKQPPSTAMSNTTHMCQQKCKGCCTYDLFQSRNSSIPTLGPEAHMASRQGFTMMRKLISPIMPKILQDFWVLAELGITITQFVLAVISLVLNTSVFNIVFIALNTIGLLLALLDSFLHFITLGSCATTFRYFRKRAKSKYQQTENTETATKGGCSCCCVKFSDKTKQRVLEVLDFIRNWLTDIILYPLVMLDLYDLITSQAYLNQSSEDSLNLSLFIISALFILLSVYLTRIVMTFTAALIFRRLPTNTSGSHKRIARLSTWFLLHNFAQILVHGSIFVSIGFNIYLENTEVRLISNSTSRTFEITNIPSSSINSSFPLIYSLVVGLLVTQIGTASFFFINYYQIREFTIAFWVDMVSLLQSENFANLVFEGSIKSIKEKTRMMAQNIKYKKVKEELSMLKSVSIFTKLLYPFRKPVFILIAVFYYVLLGSFLVSLSFACSPILETSSVMCQSFFLNPSLYSIPYFITFTFIILANIQLIISVTLWLVLILVSVVFLILAPIRTVSTIKSYCRFCPASKEL